MRDGHWGKRLMNEGEMHHTYRRPDGEEAYLGTTSVLPDGSEILLSVVAKSDYEDPQGPVMRAYDGLKADGWALVILSNFRIAQEAQIVLFWRGSAQLKTEEPPRPRAK
jgi:hypothetical protein